MKTRVAHLSSVHSWNDVRIYYRECLSLAKRGYEVYLVVREAPKGLGSADIHTIGVGSARTRLARIVGATGRIYRYARRLGASVYHFHDPELIFVGMLLKQGGAKVIYDVHENVPQQILTKDWLPYWSRRFVARLSGWAEQKAAQHLDAIVAATPSIAKRFPPEKTVVVQNFPFQDELITPEPTPYACRPPLIAYVGGLTTIRGAREMVQAMEYVNNTSEAVLVIAGSFSPSSLEQELASMAGWRRVRFLGQQTRAEVASLLGQARAGIVVFHPSPNHIEAQPNKLFEYMAAGLPVIASNFPHWQALIGSPPCGITVDPLNAHSIAQAIEWMLTHPQDAEQMGRRGRLQVVERYNWEAESAKLLALYEQLIESL
ncbi:MAG: glycosyltransferase family 4 protein [Fimbriimonadales bacterium]|nr:glycosyltransferase family 4 protein [Fimbriimonadales bacterium]